MAEVVNMAVETAIQQKKIVLLDFTKAHPCKDYYDYYIKRSQSRLKKRNRYGETIWEIDLTAISNHLIVKRIVDFVWHSLNAKRRSPRGFHEATVLPLIRILAAFSENELAEYDLFIQGIHEIEQRDFSGKQQHTGNVFACAHRLERFCIDEDYLDNPYSADMWNLRRMSIATERKNPSMDRERLYFNKFANDDNKELVKQYAKYLLLNTDNSVSTIASKIGSLANTLNCVKKPYVKWDNDDTAYMVEQLKATGQKERTTAQRIMYLEEFTEYLLLHDIIEDSPIKQYHTLTSARYDFKETATDHYVITQIFNAIGSFKDQSLCICFLLIYCTGMRVSEACTIRKDCLEKTDKAYFVRFYQIKMKKYVTNVIPESLYYMVDEYRKTVPSGTEFLFPGQHLKGARQAGTFVANFGKELERFAVKNGDGSDYNFEPHSFRHLMAVRMRNEDIPFQYIVEQLHHESPEMTLAYLEFLDKQKLAKMKAFIDIHGNRAPISSEIKVDDADYAEYMRRYINAQMLPDGVCGRPVKLGKCPHCNACLHCSDYRTSIDFIDVHIAHRDRLVRFIELASKNGWQSQGLEARETKAVLDVIIETLEKEVPENGKE